MPSTVVAGDVEVVVLLVTLAVDETALTVMELLSMSNPVTLEDATVKNVEIWLSLGTFVFSNSTFSSEMTDPFL